MPLRNILVLLEILIAHMLLLKNHMLGTPRYSDAERVTTLSIARSFVDLTIKYLTWLRDGLAPLTTAAFSKLGCMSAF